jgi:cell division protein FtsB
MVARFRKFKKPGFQPQSLIFSTILGVLVLLVIGFLVVSNLRIMHRRAELNSRLQTLKEEVRRLQEKKRQLEAGILQVSDEDFLEKEARERFNLKKPGEKVVTVLPPEGEEESQKAKKKEWWNIFSW